MPTGGASIDTGAINADRAGLNRLAGAAQGYAETNWNKGNQLLSSYETPVLDQIKQMLMGATNPGAGVDPLMNVLMGQPTEAANQAATAAKRNLMNQNLGPGMLATAMSQVDLTKMGNLQSGVLDIIKQGIAQMLGAGQQGTQMMGQTPGQLIGAGGLYAQAGQMDTQIAQLQAAAQQSGNLGLMQGLQGIGQLGGLLAMGGGPIGLGLWGAGSAAAGAAGAGAAEDVSRVTNMFNALPQYY